MATKMASPIRLLSAGFRAHMGRRMSENTGFGEFMQQASLKSAKYRALSDTGRHCRRFYGDKKVNMDLSYQDLDVLLKSGDIQLIDVREPQELLETGRIPGATNVPLGQLQNALQASAEEFHGSYGVKKPNLGDSNIVFYCRAGVRSQKALDIANAVGFSKARHLKGGWENYQKMGGLPAKP